MLKTKLELKGATIGRLFKHDIETKKQCNQTVIQLSFFSFKKKKRNQKERKDNQICLQMPSNVLLKRQCLQNLPSNVLSLIP